MNTKEIYWIIVFIFVTFCILFMKEVRCNYFCEGEYRFFLDGRCFFYEITPVTWHEAKDFCEKQGYILATMNSTVLSQEFISKIETYLQTSVWLGASHSTQKEMYTWIATNESLSGPNTSFDQNESGFLREECFVMDYDGLEDIFTRMCYYIENVFCMASDQGLSEICHQNSKMFAVGGCFFYETSKITWVQHEIFCIMHLAMGLKKKTRDLKALSPHHLKAWAIHFGTSSQEALWIENIDTVVSESEPVNYDDPNWDCVGFVTEFNLVRFPCDLRLPFICMDDEKDSLYIKSFTIYVNTSTGLFFYDSGSNLFFSCTAETYSLPSNLSITKDGRFPQVSLQNRSSLSMVKQNIDCNVIGQYTCEIKDILKTKIHREDVYVWVNECGPKVCQQENTELKVSTNNMTNGTLQKCGPKVCLHESTEHEVIIGNTTNVTLKICIIMLDSHTITKTYIVLIKNSVRIPLEFKRKYNYFLFRDPSPIKSSLHVTIFNVSMTDVGYYDCSVYFHSGYSIFYNFSITGNEKLADSADVHVFLHIGVAIIVMITLAVLGAFLRHCVFRKRTTDIVKDTMDDKPLDTENFSNEYMSVDELDDFMNLEVLNPYDTTEDSVENISYTSSSREINSSPVIPPRPAAQSDKMYSDKRRNMTHLGVHRKQALSTKKSNVAHEQIGWLNIKVDDINNIAVNNVSKPEPTNASLKNTSVKSYLVADRIDCKEGSSSNKHVEKYLDKDCESSTENKENSNPAYIEISNYSFIGNYTTGHQYLKFKNFTSENGSVNKQASGTSSVERDGLHQAFVEVSLGNRNNKPSVITLMEIVNSMGLKDYITPTDAVYAMQLHDYITPKDVVYYVGLQDYITPKDVLYDMDLHDYITQKHTGYAMGLHNYITSNDVFYIRELHDCIEAKDLDYDMGLHDYITPKDVVHDMGLQDYIKPKKLVYSMGLNDYITSKDVVYDMLLYDYITPKDMDILKVSHKMSMAENNCVSFDCSEDTTYKEEHYVVFDGAEHITDEDSLYVVFDGAEHITDDDSLYVVFDGAEIDK
ncbi:unnamed protein product [Lymnaea stagnalis]|uniref:C-type lectin domain-containing protein n=1 Tax=Lymnaea stagnalis TaxID=6523 RepID=A0AAV2ICZ3_LYMST